MSSLSPGRRLAGLALAAVTCVVLGAASGAGSAPLSVAPDGPGALSHFDLARKDCLGTARNTTSKVWFTVADGVLSDVYYPTIDNTNVETLQYVVTDGSTFTDLQTRDMTYTVEALDDSGMACEVTSDAHEREVPDRDRLRHRPGHERAPDERVRSSRSKKADNLQLYVRFDPTVNGNGGGGAGNGGADSATTDTSTGHPILVASDPITATNAANRDYAQPVYAALDGPFAEATNGFAGAASDGLVAARRVARADHVVHDASNGNVVQTARVTLGKKDDDGDLDFTLALGFGATQADGGADGRGLAADGFDRARDDYEEGLGRPTTGRSTTRRGSSRGSARRRADDLQDAYYVSANVLKASEDKTFPGAIVASTGLAVGPGDLGRRPGATRTSARTARCSRATCTRPGPA